MTGEAILTSPASFLFFVPPFFPLLANASRFRLHLLYSQILIRDFHRVWVHIMTVAAILTRPASFHFLVPPFFPLLANASRSRLHLLYSQILIQDFHRVWVHIMKGAAILTRPTLFLFFCASILSSSCCFSCQSCWPFQDLDRTYFILKSLSENNVCP